MIGKIIAVTGLLAVLGFVPLDIAQGLTDYAQEPDWIDCVLYNNGQVTVLDQLCDGWKEALNWYTTHEYHITGTQGTTMYLQK
jgi:hypothetical protein